jgi:hypothetical protein
MFAQRLTDTIGWMDGGASTIEFDGDCLIVNEKPATPTRQAQPDPEALAASQQDVAAASTSMRDIGRALGVPDTNWFSVEWAAGEIKMLKERADRLEKERDQLAEAGRELLALIDDVPFDEGSPRQTDCVFAMYEFDFLRRAVNALEPQNTEGK